MKLEHLLNEKTFRGSASKEAGELSDDPVVKSIQKQLNSLHQVN